MTENQAAKIKLALDKINMDIYQDDIKDIESVDELEEFLQDNNYFDIEIIYHYKAMEYLLENDASLQYSLEIAHDLGYSVDSLHSELLASLLASEKMKEDFAEIRNELKTILEG
jgi:hypothetical protein